MNKRILKNILWNVMILTFIVSLSGCQSNTAANGAPESNISNQTNELNKADASNNNYDYYLPEASNHANNPKSNAKAFVTNQLPPLYYSCGYGTYDSHVYMINDALYFESNASLYKSTLISGDDWDTKPLGIQNVIDLYADDHYLYILTNKDEAVIYSLDSAAIVCSVNLRNYDKDFDNIMLHCVGNQKAYYSTWRASNHEHIIFSLDLNGQISIEKSDMDYILTPLYSDKDYLVYKKEKSDGSDTHVYAENIYTNQTYQICDKNLVGDRHTAFHRWKDSFAFLIEGVGICVTDLDGGNAKIYKGNRTGGGYAFYENKVYFAGKYVVTFDFTTGKQQNLDYGEETDFTGSINVCNGTLLLDRREELRKDITVFVVPLK